MFLHDGSDWAAIWWLRRGQKYHKKQFSWHMADKAIQTTYGWIIILFSLGGICHCFLRHFAIDVMELLTVSGRVSQVTADFDKITRLFQSSCKDDYLRTVLLEISKPAMRNTLSSVGVFQLSDKFRSLFGSFWMLNSTIFKFPPSSVKDQVLLLLILYCHWKGFWC